MADRPSKNGRERLIRDLSQHLVRAFVTRNDYVARSFTLFCHDAARTLLCVTLLLGPERLSVRGGDRDAVAVILFVF